MTEKCDYCDSEAEYRFMNSGPFYCEKHYLGIKVVADSMSGESG